MGGGRVRLIERKKCNRYKGGSEQVDNKPHICDNVLALWDYECQMSYTKA
jgi:hypothetical protein